MKNAVPDENKVLTKSRHLVFAVAGLSLLLSSMSISSVAVALPVFTSAFHTTLIVAGWTVTIYEIALTASLPLAGKISDVVGRKSTFLLCIGLFTVGSLLCTLAPTIELLIIFRFVQAVGGGGILPSATGVVADIFPESRQRAIGLFSSIQSLGTLLGSNLGGWLVTSLGWRSLFWVNIPIGLVVFVASSLLLHRGSTKGGKIDFGGAMLLAASLSALMGSISLIGSGQTGEIWLATGVLFCISLVAFVFLRRREARTEDPIVDIELMKGKPFIAANVYNLVYGACVLGVMSLIPTFAVSVYGMSVLESGVILTPRSVGMIIASVVASNFLVRWGYRRPIILGTLVVVVALALLSLEPQGVTILGKDFNSLTILIVLLLLLGLGIGTASPAANNACIELMPQRVASITGIRSMFRYTGGALGVTIATLLVNTTGDAARAFFIMFAGLAIVLMATMPAIFVMPSSPNIVPNLQKESMRK